MSPAWTLKDMAEVPLIQCSFSGFVALATKFLLHEGKPVLCKAKPISVHADGCWL